MPVTFEQEYPQATEALRRASDGVFIFFSSYLMARYTAYVTTSALPAETVASSLDEAGIAFGVAAIFSIIGVARRQSSYNLAINIGIVLLTGFLAFAGILTGLVGIEPMNSGYLCAGLAAVSTLQAVASFSGMLGGIAGAIATGKMIGAGHIATGILAGIVTSIIVTAAVVLVALIVGLCVAMTMVAFVGDNSSAITNALFVAIPTGICSGLGGGFTIWMMDGFVLKVLDGLQDLPDGFVGGAIFGIVLGFVLGANIGFSACFEHQSNRNRDVVIVEEV